MIVMKKNNNKGFSLIELSIVLVIMGLLVAGVTGGASLIKSAQLRTVVTETTNFRSAFNTYYAQFGKVPGAEDSDPSVVGTTGWEDLHDEGIIDKSPVSDTYTTNNTTLGSYVISKFGRSSKFYIVGTSSEWVSPTDFASTNVLIFTGKNDFSIGTLTDAEIKNIDEKLDDGDAENGLFRGIRVADDGIGITLAPYNTDHTKRQWSFINKLDF